MSGCMLIFLVVLIFFVLFATLGKGGVSLAVSESEATFKIDEAETAVNSAYIEVLEAGEKGVDV